ncbi:P-loop containing nucleoside triphosphate hydrolase protein [Mycena olivaceomarginata]|nr:P-loop containing nucleoside triphosphate hydrolase protein [Mycena olivaceomarginata]
MDASRKTPRDHFKALLDILKQLRGAGIQREVKLPCIVAAGVQSAGKSSVMEAITTVGSLFYVRWNFGSNIPQVPPLSVDITLRFASGKADVPFRANLSDLDEICRAIAEAQENILTLNLTSIETTDTLRDGARTFSEDCVCVFAKGPNMHDLYFYDIPGVIHDVRDGQDPGQIELIQNLVKKYVSKPNCIVLLVVNCEYDSEIGGVGRLITDADPGLKARTVGVLTKVDLIKEGMGPTWLEMFNNKTRKFDNGWFAVKLPAGVDIPWEEARKQERHFFEVHEPWKSIVGEDRNRLGSEQLTQHISKLLSIHMADMLPSIYQEITDIIHECDDSLDLLPVPEERDAQVVVVAAIEKFSNDFLAHVEGIPPRPFTMDVGLVYRVNQLYRNIVPGISEHAPRFCPSNTPGNGALPGSSPVWSQLHAKGEIVYLDQMMKYMEGAVTRELPGELPWKIIRTIIIEFVQHWQDAALKVFREVKTHAVVHFNALVQAHFAEYERGGLLSDIMEILEANITHCAASTVAELKKLAAMELEPSTVLREEYTVLRATIHQQYRSALAPDPAHEASLWAIAADIFLEFLVKNGDGIAVEIAAGAISAATRKSLIDRCATSVQLGHESNSKEKDRDNALEVMSSAQAYLELASKRFADVAAKCIDHSFLHTLAERMRHELRTLAPNTSPQMCMRLIQDPTIVERRGYFIERKAHYTRVKNIVDNARRDLESDTPGLHTRRSQQTAPTDTRPQSYSDSEASHAPLSVDHSGLGLAGLFSEQ